MLNGGCALLGSQGICYLVQIYPHPLKIVDYFGQVTERFAVLLIERRIGVIKLFDFHGAHQANRAGNKCHHDESDKKLGAEFEIVEPVHCVFLLSKLEIIFCAFQAENNLVNAPVLFIRFGGRPYSP